MSLHREYKCELSIKKENIYYEWKINEFSKFSRNYALSLKSQFFSSSDDASVFFLEFFPNNLQVGLMTSSVDVFVERLAFGIINAHGQQSLKKFTQGSSVYLHLKEDLLRNAHEYLPNDTLTIFSELTIEFPANQQTRKVYTPLQIKEEIKIPESKQVASILINKNSVAQIVKDKFFCDIKFSVEGKEFQAHKVILAFRSLAFYKMLTESSKSVIEIKDVSANAFSQMLEFIYTGKIQMDKIDDELLLLAYEYKLHELKSICEKNLFQKLSVKSAAKILIMAYKSDSRKLKELTIKFINEKVKAVMETPGYGLIVKSYPQLVAEIFEARVTQEIKRPA